MLEQITLAVVISVIFGSFSVYFSLRNAKHTDVKDVAEKEESEKKKVEERVKENVTINMKLDEISRNVTDTRQEVASLRKDINSHNERLIKVEESCKSAHHRLNMLESRINVEKEE